MATQTEVSSVQLPAEAVMRTGAFTVEAPRLVRPEGYEWEHEVRVALPPSYGETTKAYPVLWLTDNSLELAVSVLGAVDLIVVGVGGGRISQEEFSRRRCYDFYPLEDMFPPGARGEQLRREIPARLGYGPLVGGGAKRFLDFLVDDLRSMLASEYRMDPSDQALAGYSAGGAFVGYSLFARPGAFAKYICGSPALYTGDNVIFGMEERHAAEHDDLPARVFFGAGEAEVTEPLISAFGCVSSMVSLAELLSCRGYPSLELTVRIFPGETHGTAFPLILGWAVRSLWGDATAG